MSRISAATSKRGSTSFVIRMSSPRCSSKRRKPRRPSITGKILPRRQRRRQGSVSRRLKCYRARIVAPLAMLPCALYGHDHRECAQQTGVCASDLSTVEAGAGWTFVGIVAETAALEPPWTLYPFLGPPERLPQIICEHRPDRVIVAIGRSTDQALIAE